jgi:hypothetical protein
MTKKSNAQGEGCIWWGISELLPLVLLLSLPEPTKPWQAMAPAIWLLVLGLQVVIFIIYKYVGEEW